LNNYIFLIFHTVNIAIEQYQAALVSSLEDLRIKQRELVAKEEWIVSEKVEINVLKTRENIHQNQIDTLLKEKDKLSKELVSIFSLKRASLSPNFVI